MKVSDFGIAKARTATQAGASLMLKGKPAYMSPEQIRGLALDGRSDIFAVGVMLWELLCGASLFHDPHDMSATLAAVMFGDTPPPSARAPRAVPDDIERVTMRMLQRDRAERPDASSALDALTACADYPRSGREALAQLLSERVPERAPQRAVRRSPQPALLGAGPTKAPAEQRRDHAAPPPEPPAGEGGAPSPHTAARQPSEAPGGLRLALRSPGSLVVRMRRSRLRGALFAATLLGVVGGAALHLTDRRSSQVTTTVPVPVPAPLAAHARSAGVAAAEPASVAPAPLLPRADVRPPTPEAAPDRALAKSEGTRPRASLRAGSTDVHPAASRPLSVGASPARPPAGKGGMGILDLDEPRRSATELDLGREP